MKNVQFAVLIAVFVVAIIGCQPEPPLPERFTVTFNANGGEPTPSQQTIEKGKKATEPQNVTKANNTLDGWYKESGFTTKWNFASDTVTADITLYAKWTETLAHTHQWGAWTLTTPATCTTAGEETRVCALDPTHTETQTIAIDPNTHQWGAWTVTTPATATADGEETRTCEHNPAHKETRPIERTEPAIKTFPVSFDFLNPENPDSRYNATIKDERTDCGSATLEDIKVGNKNIVTIIEEAIMGGFNTGTGIQQAINRNRFRRVFGRDNYFGIPLNVIIIIHNSSNYYEGVEIMNLITIKIHIDYLIGNSADIQDQIKESVAELNGMSLDNYLPEVTYGELIYRGNDERLIITNYNGSGGALIIPETISNIPVVAINSFAFAGTQGYNSDYYNGVGLTSVSIPNSVTFIGRSAFNGNQLTNVLIPNSVTTIGRSAFANNQLTSITIPDNIITIEEMTFAENQLISIIIPDSVSTIEWQAFSHRDQPNPLLSITIGADVTIDTRLGLDSFPVEGFGDTYNITYNKAKGTYTRTDNTSETWTKE
jgi:uncharacterized repeat protein (TIGR02543 family)